MTLKEYLDECKEKLAVTTSYKLSQHMDIAESRLSEYYKGKTAPGDYECFMIAEVLGLDPALVIADVRAEFEKSEKKREYFRSFPGALRKAGVVIIVALALSLSLLNAPVAGDPAGSAALMAGGLLFLCLLYFA